MRALQSVSLRTSALEPLDSEISRVCHCLLFPASYSVVFRVCQLWGCNNLVLVRLPDNQVGSKLDPRWSEPRRVVRRLTNGVTYEIRSLDTGASSDVHILRLSAFRPYAATMPVPTAPDTAVPPTVPDAIAATSPCAADAPPNDDDDDDDDWWDSSHPTQRTASPTVTRTRPRSPDRPASPRLRRHVSPGRASTSDAAHQRLLDLLCPSTRGALP